MPYTNARLTHNQIRMLRPSLTNASLLSTNTMYQCHISSVPPGRHLYSHSVTTCGQCVASSPQVSSYRLPQHMSRLRWHMGSAVGTHHGMVQHMRFSPLQQLWPALHSPRQHSCRAHVHSPHSLVLGHAPPPSIPSIVISHV